MREAPCCAIDIGTNTLLAIVGRNAPDASPERIADFQFITRLGAGVDRTRRLAPDAMDRALAALSEAFTAARALGVRRFAAVATSAVRDADNRDEFLDGVRALIGDDVQVIAGEREAELTFAGATLGTTVADGTEVLAFDVGGGSTEIVGGPAGGATRSRRSIDIGSVRLAERHLASDPPATSDLAALRADIARALTAAGAAPPHRVLMGLAATVTTLAAIARQIAGHDGATVRGLLLARDEVDAVTDRLAASSLEARRAMVGLDPRRADVIVAGAEIVRAVMHWSAARSLVVSDGGVRVGLLRELLAAETAV